MFIKMLTLPVVRIAALIAVGLALLFPLDYFGWIWHNSIWAVPYPVKGLDVSHHQGSIDWARVAATNRYQFVYIKATEGHDFTDDRFQENWQGASQAGLLVGAYHFFSTRSSGVEQAELFIKMVPKQSKTLPPVIDIEIAIDKDKQRTRDELTAMINKLQAHYDQEPILYVTYETYHAYIEGHFSESPIWIRDVYKPPYLANRQWLLWQYNNRGHVPGIATYVDINVFKGTSSELYQLTVPE